ncbi:MAG: YitT family protein, partial [Spirochaetales bacterium]|nr:YitT family protein [Spirochaetales bacterium]
MSILKKSILTQIKEWLLVTFGILIYVGGWSIFLIPNNLVGGGVSGISSMIQYATQGTIQMGYSYFVINAILLLLAVIILGKGFGAKTLYAIILASVALRFLPDLIPVSITNTLALQNGKLMSVIMGGLMAGIGIGMSITNGGSTGGTDIIALIWTKYHNVSPGSVILFLDFFIISSSLIVPSYVNDVDPVTGAAVLDAAGNPIRHLMPFADKITTVVYGLILVTVNSYVMDMYINGQQQSVQLFILSKNYDKIADAIT